MDPDELPASLYPDKLHPLAIEALISNCPSEYYKLLTCSEENETEVFSETRDGRMYFYRFSVMLPKNYYLKPFVNRNGSSPILKVENKEMESAYYELSHRDLDNEQVNTSQIINAISANYSIDKERIYVLSEDIGLKTEPIYAFLDNEDFPLPIPRLLSFSDLPPSFLSLAEYLSLERTFLAKSSKAYQFCAKKQSETKLTASSVSVSDVYIERFEKGPFKNEDLIINPIVNHVSRYFLESKSRISPKLKQFFNPIINLIQSSGYGKSRTAIRLGERIPVLYISLQDGRTGYPRPSLLFSKFIEWGDSFFAPHRSGIHHENDMVIISYVFILRVVALVLQYMFSSLRKKAAFRLEDLLPTLRTLENSITLDILFESLVSGFENVKGNLYEFSDESTITLRDEHKPFEFKFGDSLSLIVDDIEEFVVGNIQVIRDVYACGNSSNVPCPLIFVLDEAHALLYKKINGDSRDYEDRLWFFEKGSMRVFNVFRRAFRAFDSIWEQMWPMLISTNGKITNFLKRPGNDDSLKPFTTIKFVPHFKFKNSFGVSLGSITKKQKEITDWKEYINSKNRYEDLFKCGRPVIYETLCSYILNGQIEDHHLNTPFIKCEEVVHLVQKILCEGSNPPWGPFNEYQIYALLSLSTSLDAYPKEISKENLIKSHLMTLLHYDTYDEEAIALYPPEGALNTVATILAHFSLSEQVIKIKFNRQRNIWRNTL